MKNVSKQLIVISIILLLIGVSVSSATTNVVIKNLIDDNQPPSAPVITHPFLLFGKVGESIPFTFNAVDPDGDNVSYLIDWGDGTSYGWTEYYTSGQPITISHTWDEVNWFMIHAKAKDEHGLIGPEGTTNIPITKNKDCGCNEVSDADLVNVERLLDRVEVYSKLLLVLSRHNPEIQEEIEELLDLINPDSLRDFPIICNIIDGISDILEDIWIFLVKWIDSTKEGTLANQIAKFFYEKVSGIMDIIWFIGVVMDCYEVDPYP